MTTPEQCVFLTNGTDQVISQDELNRKLQLGRPLRIKLGFDPSSPDLHLGHAVVLTKLRQFQDLGHMAVIIVGDYTARIGDPTGRSKTRVPLEPEQISINAKTYTDQVFKILDPERTEIRRNSEWFDKFTYADVLRLNGQMTVSQLLERDDFRKRYQGGFPITVTEFQYPLMQGYDSIMVKSDIELGGSDQLFNNLVGRDLQKWAKQEAQVVMVLPLIEGVDGVEKMSKSLGNCIGITESPQEMFGKTMRISDELMARWYKILSSVSMVDVQDMALHPMESKKRLASRLITRFHSEAAAREARENFERIFSQNEIPEEIPEFSFKENPIGLIKVLTEIKATTSGSEARRLIAQGGVSLNGQKIQDPKYMVTFATGPMVLRCGKRFFARLSTVHLG